MAPSRSVSLQSDSARYSQSNSLLPRTWYRWFISVSKLLSPSRRTKARSARRRRRCAPRDGRQTYKVKSASDSRDERMPSWTGSKRSQNAWEGPALVLGPAEAFSGDVADGRSSQNLRLLAVASSLSASLGFSRSVETSGSSSGSDSLSSSSSSDEGGSSGPRFRPARGDAGATRARARPWSGLRERRRLVWLDDVAEAGGWTTLDGPGACVAAAWEVEPDAEARARAGGSRMVVLADLTHWRDSRRQRRHVSTGWGGRVPSCQPYAVRDHAGQGPATSRGEGLNAWGGRGRPGRT